jgi:hypothetical protein
MMIKLFLGTLAILAIGISNVQAQDSFYEGIEKYEGQTFQYYYGADEIEGRAGHYKLRGDWYQTTYKVIKTESGLAYAAEFKNEDGRLMSLGNLTRGATVDNYTYPSVIGREHSSDVYIFIDGMLIDLVGFSDDGSFKSIGRIAMLVKEVEEVVEEEPKKKLTMKEKIAAAKLKLSDDGSSSAEKAFMELDLHEVVTSYLKEIKTKQKTADPAQEAKYKTEIENADAAFLAKRQSQSREYAAKLNAQKDDGASSYKVKNTSGSSVRIINDSGTTMTLNAGSSTSYSCNVDVFYCVGTSDKGALIANGDDSCGQTVSID